MTRPADCCGLCGVQLQPMPDSSLYLQQARTLAAGNGLQNPGPLLLALLAHVLVVHRGSDSVPALVPWQPHG